MQNVAQRSSCRRYSVGKLILNDKRKRKLGPTKKFVVCAQHVSPIEIYSKLIEVYESAASNKLVLHSKMVSHP